MSIPNLRIAFVPVFWYQTVPPHHRYQLEIDVSSWPSNIGTPVMFIDRVFLVHVHLKELVVDRAFEVFEPAPRATISKLPAQVQT